MVASSLLFLVTIYSEKIPVQSVRQTLNNIIELCQRSSILLIALKWYFYIVKVRGVFITLSKSKEEGFLKIVSGL